MNEGRNEGRKNSEIAGLPEKNAQHEEVLNERPSKEFYVYCKEPGVEGYAVIFVRRIHAGKYIASPILCDDLDIDTVLSREDTEIIERYDNKWYFQSDGGEFDTLTEAVISLAKSIELKRRSLGTYYLPSWEWEEFKKAKFYIKKRR